ncbi:MAG: AbrB family transcriptional regulator [Hyphomicrobiaceae bacterium]
MRTTVCIAIAFVGGLTAAVLSLPLPYMLGAIAASMFAAMVGVPIERPSFAFVSPMRVILGVLLGSAITPELIERMDAVAGSAALVPLYVMISAIIGTYFYERVAGYSREEAYFCALPGGLHVMTMYAEERGIDIRRVALAHALRITFVVILATIVTSLITDLPRISVSDATVSITEVDLGDFGLLTIAGLVGWLIGRQTGMPGAQMVMPMMCSAALHITGITSAKPPAELIIAAQVILGANIGSRFVGQKVDLLIAAMGHALAHVSLMLCVAAGCAAVLNLAFGLPILTGLLSFSPGGMSEIGLIALALGLDVGVVATIQLCRLMSINLLGPFVLRQIGWLLKSH